MERNVPGKQNQVSLAAERSAGVAAIKAGRIPLARIAVAGRRRTMMRRFTLTRFGTIQF
jgi:hypothetical protein